MITIDCTQTEFLIRAPHSNEARIAGLGPYKWNLRDRTWRLPISRSVYKNIKSEWGPEELAWSPRCAAHVRNFTKEEIDAIEGTIRANREQIERNEYVISIFEVAEAHGLPEDSDTEALFNFIAAALESNAVGTDKLVQLAVAKSEMTALRSELELSKLDHSPAEPRNEKQTLLSLVMGTARDSSVDALLSNVDLDRNCAIRLQTIAHRLISGAISESHTGVSFSELIERAVKDNVLSASAATLCHTFRVQRNLFAHEEVPDDEVIPRASIAFISFLSFLSSFRGRNG